MKWFNTKKVKLSDDQFQVVAKIAEELSISKEDVLWNFVEFGMNLMVQSQTDQRVLNSIKKMEHLTEYKNWRKIAKLQYEFYLTGAKKHHNEKNN